MQKINLDELKESTTFILAIQSEVNKDERFIKKLLGKVDLELNKVKYEIYINNIVIYTFFNAEKAILTYNSLRAK